MKNTTSPPKTVCLIDDEPDITSVIKRGMELNGFLVHVFNDPNKAWEYFSVNGKDCTVVLSDVKMPGMSGLEFCRRVKEARPEAPTILMTAFEVDQSNFPKVNSRTAIDGFIRKPISLQKLIETIYEMSPPAK